MKISVLGSGSSGNSIYFETSDNRFLIDAGFSGKSIENRLKKINVDPETLTSIIVTHEHFDHIQGVGVLSRKYNLPIYITQKSYNVAKKKMGQLASENIKYIEKNFYLSENTCLEPFEVMHDAKLTLGFNVFDRNNTKVSVATDIGYISKEIKEKFKKSDVIIIESNYSYHMLMTGSYPWHLKNRVKSKKGHLSNDQTSKFLEKIWSQKLKKIYLAHLSKDNNKKELAYEKTHDCLKKSSKICEIEVCDQHEPLNIFEI